MGERIRESKEAHVDRLEMLSIDCLVDYIINLGANATEIENDMNIAAEVLKNAYNLTVEQVLQQRQLDNKTS